MIPLNFDEHLVNKQNHYDVKMTKQVLSSLTSNSFHIANQLRQAGESLGFSWFNRTFVDCPIALGTRKLQAPVGLLTITKSFERSEIYRMWQEVQSDHSNRDAIGLVFDHHGDGLADCVVHNTTYLINDSHWRLLVPDPQDTTHKNFFVIQEWKPFLQTLADKYCPFT